MSTKASLRVFRGDSNGGKLESYEVRNLSGHGRPRRHPRDSGQTRADAGRPVELQSGLMWFVQRGRSTASRALDVHDADVSPRRGQAGDGDADARVPAC